jgi:hypothetical protein
MRGQKKKTRARKMENNAIQNKDSNSLHPIHWNWRVQATVRTCHLSQKRQAGQEQAIEHLIAERYEA